MSASRVFAVPFLCGLMLCLPALSQTTPPAAPAAPPAQNPVQTPPATPPTQFKSTSIEVIVPVTVTDDKGRFVSNLVKEDFRVLDEGRPQNIEFFSHDEKQPIVVG